MSDITKKLALQAVYRRLPREDTFVIDDFIVAEVRRTHDAAVRTERWSALGLALLGVFFAVLFAMIWAHSAVDARVREATAPLEDDLLVCQDRLAAVEDALVDVYGTP